MRALVPQILRSYVLYSFADATCIVLEESLGNTSPSKLDPSHITTRLALTSEPCGGAVRYLRPSILRGTGHMAKLIPILYEERGGRISDCERDVGHIARWIKATQEYTIGPCPGK